MSAYVFLYLTIGHFLLNMFFDYNSLFLVLFFLWVLVHFIKGLFSIYIDYSSISTVVGGHSNLVIAFYFYCVFILVLNLSDVFCHNSEYYLIATTYFVLNVS